METLIYQIRKVDEIGNSEILHKSENESFVKEKWETLKTEKGYDYSLECGWFVNERSLGINVVEFK
jgi:hypothetical protein